MSFDTKLPEPALFLPAVSLLYASAKESVNIPMIRANDISMNVKRFLLSNLFDICESGLVFLLFSDKTNHTPILNL